MSGEYYIETHNTSNTHSDRYKSCKILKDIETGESFLATRLPIDEIPVRTNDIYHTVKTNEVTRLDVIAHTYYKNPLLWWVIAQANDIYNPFEEIASGTILRVPAIETLYGNKGILL